MQFLVIAEARDTIVGDDVRWLRQGVAAAMQRIKASGKLIAGGVIAGRRMPFFLLDVADADEVTELLGSELIDSFQCNVYPINSFDFIGKFFAEHPV